MTLPTTILHADDSPRFRNLVSGALSGDCRVISVGTCDAVLPVLRKVAWIW